MLSSHLTALPLPRAASLPRAGLAMLQGPTTLQLARLTAESNSRPPCPTSIPGSPEHEQRSHPQDCSAPQHRSSSRSPHEYEQFAQPRDARNRQWLSLRRLQYRGSCGVEFYNFERPHEALGQDVPASRYRPSVRPMPERLPRVEYEAHEIVRTVPDTKDYVRFRGQLWKVPQAFRGKRVAIRPLSTDGCFGLFFASHQIAAIDCRSRGGYGDACRWVPGIRKSTAMNDGRLHDQTMPAVRVHVGITTHRGEFPPAIPRRVAPQQSPSPLHRLRLTIRRHPNFPQSRAGLDLTPMCPPCLRTGVHRVPGTNT